MNKQKGFCLWFTGLPCSGKTTIAKIVEDKLKEKGMNVECLDGDVVRQSLTRDLGFSKEDRDKNIERVTFVAKLLSRNGVAALVSFVSPYIGARDNARKECTNFIEAYVKCPVEECEKRDVKGMYKKARRGEIKDFTGIDDPYEEPLNPELVLETDKEDAEKSASRILKKLGETGFIDFYDDIYSPEEEEQIKKRLKDLGYIE